LYIYVLVGVIITPHNKSLVKLYFFVVILTKLHKGYDKMKNIIEMQMNFMTNQIIRRNKK